MVYMTNNANGWWCRCIQRRCLLEFIANDDGDCFGGEYKANNGHDDDDLVMDEANNDNGWFDDRYIANNDGGDGDGKGEGDRAHEALLSFHLIGLV